MAEYSIQIRQGSKQTREPAIHYAANIIGFGMLMKLMRYLRQIYNAFRMGYYDYVLLLLIISATLTQWSRLVSTWD
jgi:predicted tellurium resistance membrane protein TerC